jgi:hypothetical protein
MRVASRYTAATNLDRLRLARRFRETLTCLAGISRWVLKPWSDSSRVNQCAVFTIASSESWILKASL